MKHIKELLSILWDKVDYGLRWLCYGLSPAGRLITVLSFCVIFGIMSIYITVSSIYNIGKQDAKKEFLELKIGGSQMEHMQQLKLPIQSNDSINFINQKKYE